MADTQNDADLFRALLAHLERQLSFAQGDETKATKRRELIEAKIKRTKELIANASER